MKAKYAFVIVLLICASCENPWMREILEPKTITYESNGGNRVPRKTVIKGVKVPMQWPSRIGYAFVAWYIDNGTFEEPWDFDVVPTADITLYAKWKLEPGSDGLEYALINGNTAYRVSRGTATGDIFIPVYYSPDPENGPYLPVTTISNGVDNDTSNAFGGSNSYNPAITSITFATGSQLTAINNSAFYGCRNLASINIPAGVTYIGESAFNMCYKLTGITIPAGITSISDYTFVSCTGLAGITLPNNLTSIGYEAFIECESLASITIPASVTSISENAFYGCLGLKTVTFAAGSQITAISGNAFGNCNSLTSINIPSSVTSIGYMAFNSCISLTSITLPNNLTTIGTNAFDYCISLTSITIPSSVTSIESNAFYDCHSLTSVTFAGTIASGSFDNGTGWNTVFPGNLRAKFYETNATNGTPGTYTTILTGSADSRVWTRQP
jgi:uncharacterized repeat protein (TIGR02543 family)